MGAGNSAGNDCIYWFCGVTGYSKIIIPVLINVNDLI